MKRTSKVVRRQKGKPLRKVLASVAGLFLWCAAVSAHAQVDGRADLVVWRPSNGVWYVLTSSSNCASSFAVTWGQGGDIPLVGDYQ
jgi:hypothetical protein